MEILGVSTLESLKLIPPTSLPEKNGRDDAFLVEDH